MKILCVLLFFVLGCSGPADIQLDTDAGATMRGPERAEPGDVLATADVVDVLVTADVVDVLVTADVVDVHLPPDRTAPETGADDGARRADVPELPDRGAPQDALGSDASLDERPTPDVAHAPDAHPALGDAGSDVPPDATDPHAACGALTACGACLAQPRDARGFGCGWCRASGECLYGSAAGNFRGSCESGWRWTTTTCE